MNINEVSELLEVHDVTFPSLHTFGGSNMSSAVEKQVATLVLADQDVPHVCNFTVFAIL